MESFFAGLLGLLVGRGVSQEDAQVVVKVLQEYLGFEPPVGLTGFVLRDLEQGEKKKASVVVRGKTYPAHALEDLIKYDEVSVLSKTEEYLDVARTISHIADISLLKKVDEIGLVALINRIALIDAINNIINIETIGNMPDPTPHGSEGIAFRQATAGTGQWISPTGHEDTTAWSDPENTYDEDIETFAQEDYGGTSAVPAYSWGSFLTLTHSTLTSNKLRINAKHIDSHVTTVDIDVFKDGEWIDVYEGEFPDHLWMQKSFTQGTVTKMRVRFYNGSGYWVRPAMYEVDFWEVTQTGGDMIIQELGRLESPPENTHITKKAYAYDEDDDIETVKFYEGENLLFTLTYGYDGSKNITTITRS